MREHLVVVRCGRASTHPAWVVGDAPRNFDLLLCPYQDAPGGADLPSLSRTIPGQKWTGLSQLLRRERAWEGYSYVWLPDDDLETDAATISRFFERCREYDASLAAPALAEGSQYSHLLTLRNRAFRARATTFVEIMAPCFRRDVLARLLPTFAKSRTGYGWGLDDAWARSLGYRGLFVMDDTAVRHDRPVGALRSPEQAKAVREEMLRIHRRFDACAMRKTVGGVAAAGNPVDPRSADFLDAYLSGYRWLFDRDPTAEARLRRDQAKDADAWLRDAGSRTRRAGARSWWRRAFPRRDRSRPTDV